MKTQQITFDQFLGRFPELPLPITLGDKAHYSFSQHNDPLSQQMIQQYIFPLEQEDADELTEFIACFRVPETHGFHAIIYWKAGLMNYQYILATFNKKGILIDKRVIAGTYVDDNVVTQSVATMDEDWIIYIATGQKVEEMEGYNPASSTVFKLELLPDGKIVNIT